VIEGREQRVKYLGGEGREIIAKISAEIILSKDNFSKDNC